MYGFEAGGLQDSLSAGSTDGDSWLLRNSSTTSVATSFGDDSLELSEESDGSGKIPIPGRGATGAISLSVWRRFCCLFGDDAGTVFARERLLDDLVNRPPPSHAPSKLDSEPL